jgi:hypothetical protein
MNDKKWLDVYVDCFFFFQAEILFGFDVFGW